MSEPVIEALSVLDMREGDTLIVRLPKPPTEEEAHYTKNLVKSQLAIEAPVLVVGPGVTFEIVRPGRCGELAPTVRSLADRTSTAICALPARHDGWHRSDDGMEWGEQPREFEGRPERA